jgi:hypothetical protein
VPRVTILPSLRAGLLLCSALTLAACGALPARDELSGPPRTTYQSGKAPAAYIQCLTPLWQAETVVGGKATVTSAPAPGGGTRLTLNVSGSPARVVDVVAQGSGSTIRYWNRSHDFGGGKPQAVEAIENCR